MRDGLDFSVLIEPGEAILTADAAGLLAAKGNICAVASSTVHAKKAIDHPSRQLVHRPIAFRVDNDAAAAPMGCAHFRRLAHFEAVWTTARLRAVHLARPANPRTT